MICSFAYSYAYEDMRSTLYINVFNFVLVTTKYVLFYFENSVLDSTERISESIMKFNKEMLYRLIGL